MNKLLCRTFLILLLAVCCTSAFAEDVSLAFSLESGFYADPMQLEIACEAGNAQIYYTTDGSIPDETDTLYERPIPLPDTTDMEDTLSKITGITPGEPFIVEKDFPSAHIIRAVAITPDGERSAVVSGTYFVGYDRQELYGDTAIMLLAIDPSHLFDYNTGIYANGYYYDEWLKEQTEAFESWQGQGNFSQRGSEWERPVTVTYLPAEGEGFTQDMGVRIKGGVSRTNNQKSLRLIARSDYGEKNVKYELFPDNLREADGAVVAKYKSFTLRNGGNDCDFAKIRDPYFARLAEGMRFETAANMPVIAFINGEYWGLYTLNEEYTDNFIEYHYGIDSKNVITVKVGEVDDGEAEDIELFDEMFNYIVGHDMTDPAAYAKASEMLDMGSFADYAALHFYIGNTDGPFLNNNWEMWRVRQPGKDDSPCADGKWRMMLYDTDHSSGVFSGGSTFGDNPFSSVLKMTEYDSERHPAQLFNALIQNEDFRAEFILATCDVRNLHFSKARAGALLDEMTSWYAPYQTDTYLRFGPDWVKWDPEGHFKRNLDGLRSYINGRANRFIGLLKQSFKLDNPKTITVSLTGEGEVIINDRSAAPLTEKTSVQYFPGCSLTVTAVPAEGKTFAGWQLSNGNGTLADPSAETTVFTFTDMVELTAVFE